MPLLILSFIIIIVIVIVLIIFHYWGGACYEAFLKLGALIPGTGRRFFLKQIAVSRDWTGTSLGLRRGRSAPKPIKAS